MPREGARVKYWLLCRHCRPGRAFVAATGHDTHQISGISRADLVHDARAMHFYRARTDAEAAADFLVRGALGDLAKHLAFTRRQKIITGKIDPVGMPAAPTEGGYGAADPRDDGPRVERFDQVVERAALH